MEKRGPIPGAAKTPMGAPVKEVHAVQARLAKLGIDYFKAMAEVGYSEPTAYRLQNGTGSVKALRELDEYTKRQELARKIATPEETEMQIDEWNELGQKLLKLDADEFARTLAGLRQLVEAEEMRGAAIRKMFRATPEPQK